MSLFPSQKLTLKEKLAKAKGTDRTWGENSVAYLVDNSNWATDHTEIKRLRRVLDGEYTESDYNYILNPLNTNVEQYKRFGAKFRNFNIISPVKDLYMGEFGKRFKNITVLESNPGDSNMYKEGLKKLVDNWHTQQTVNALNEAGIETGQETVEQDTLKNTIAKYRRDFDANRVITGQETLDFLRFDKELDDVYQDIYEDWLTVGRGISYKGIFHDDIDFEHVPAEELSFPKNGSGFIEDKAWAVRRMIKAPHEILDRHGPDLSEEAKTWLHSQLAEGASTMHAPMVVLPSQWIKKGDKFATIGNHDGVELFHVVWRSWQKVGVLTYTDELGQVTTMKVDDSYKLDTNHGDIDIEWDWISEVWEGYQMDEFFFSIRPLPYNRMELNNEGKQKLPYNGRVMLTADGGVKSIVKTGEPYQALFDVAHYQFEKVMNKNRSKLIAMPIGLIPKGKNGWDEEKFMYYSLAGDFLMYDESQPTAGLAIQGIKTLDTSLGTYIKDMRDIMEAIKFEWWDSIGMNRQRFGDTNSSDGKGVNEQAIFRSAIISEELNRKFEKYQEKDYAGILDLSKLAFLNGKKGKYITTDDREAFLEINADDAIHRLESSFGVFVRNSSDEKEKFDYMKQLAFSYAQNDRNPSMLMEILDSRNFTKAKHIIKAMEDAQRKLDDQKQQQLLESNERVEQSRAASEQAKRDTEVYKADKDYDKVIDSKIMELSGSANKDAEGQTRTSDDITKERETTRMNDHKIKVDNSKLNLDKQEQSRKEKETNAKIKNMATKVT